MRKEIIVVLCNSKAFQVTVGNARLMVDKISTYAQKLLWQTGFLHLINRNSSERQYRIEITKTTDSQLLATDYCSFTLPFFLFSKTICVNNPDENKSIYWLNSSFEPTARVYRLPGIVCETVVSAEIPLINSDLPDYNSDKTVISLHYLLRYLS